MLSFKILEFHRKFKILLIVYNSYNDVKEDEFILGSNEHADLDCYSVEAGWGSPEKSRGFCRVAQISDQTTTELHLHYYYICRFLTF